MNPKINRHFLKLEDFFRINDKELKDFKKSKEYSINNAKSILRECKCYEKFTEETFRCILSNKLEEIKNYIEQISKQKNKNLKENTEKTKEFINLLKSLLNSNLDILNSVELINSENLKKAIPKNYHDYIDELVRIVCIEQVYNELKLSDTYESLLKNSPNDKIKKEIQERYNSFDKNIATKNEVAKAFINIIGNQMNFLNKELFEKNYNKIGKEKMEPFEYENKILGYPKSIPVTAASPQSDFNIASISIPYEPNNTNDWEPLNVIEKEILKLKQEKANYESSANKNKLEKIDNNSKSYDLFFYGNADKKREYINTKIKMLDKTIKQAEKEKEIIKLNKEITNLEIEKKQIEENSKKSENIYNTLNNEKIKLIKKQIELKQTKIKQNKNEKKILNLKKEKDNLDVFKNNLKKLKNDIQEAKEKIENIQDDNSLKIPLLYEIDDFEQFQTADLKTIELKIRDVNKNVNELDNKKIEIYNTCSALEREITEINSNIEKIIETTNNNNSDNESVNESDDSDEERRDD